MELHFATGVTRSQARIHSSGTLRESFTFTSTESIGDATVRKSSHPASVEMRWNFRLETRLEPSR